MFFISFLIVKIFFKETSKTFLDLSVGRVGRSISGHEDHHHEQRSYSGKTDEFVRDDFDDGIRDVLVLVLYSREKLRRISRKRRRKEGGGGGDDDTRSPNAVKSMNKDDDDDVDDLPLQFPTSVDAQECTDWPKHQEFLGGAEKWLLRALLRVLRRERMPDWNELQ